jgi:type II secretory pathway pseudopilin PulG
MDLLFLISILTTALVLALLALVRQVRLQRALRRLLTLLLNQRRHSDAHFDSNAPAARDGPDGL